MATGDQNDPIIVENWTEFKTAVATNGVYVELKKDLHKTSDRTVNPDKLYLDSNGVVQTNVQNSDLPNLYENRFVLDANSTDGGFPSGVDTTIAINCASINGNGATIINLSGSSVNLFNVDGKDSSGNVLWPTKVSISNIAFININAGNVYFVYESYPVSYTKCLFSGQVKNVNNNTIKMFGQNNDFGGNIESDYTSCSFNVTISKNVNLFNWGTNENGALLEYCRVELHILSDGYYTGQTWVQAKNCYFTGDSELRYTLGFTAGSEYCIIELAADDTNTDLDYKTTMSAMLVNTDVFKGYYSSSRFIGVTTATLASASDLAALGFPIQL